MKKIYKYILPITDNPVIQVPKDAILLDIQVQNDIVVCWLIVNTESYLVDIIFKIYGTGSEINTDKLLYLKTVKTHNDKLIWHIFMNPSQDIELQFPRL